MLETDKHDSTVVNRRLPDLAEWTSTRTATGAMERQAESLEPRANLC